MLNGKIDDLQRQSGEGSSEMVQLRDWVNCLEAGAPNGLQLAIIIGQPEHLLRTPAATRRLRVFSSLRTPPGRQRCFPASRPRPAEP